MKLTDAIRLLRESGVTDPVYDARELFAHFCGVSRAALFGADPDIDSEELSRAVKRRRKREPLQYIIGEVGFFKEVYEVSPDCLIPRADTESLVEYAVKNIPSGERFLDLCAGSGCVGISTLKHTDRTEAALADISLGALGLAERNARRNGVSDRCSFLLRDVLLDAIEGEYYAVLSNPPYVTEEEYSSLEREIYFEPRIAFVGKDGGLEFYKRITELYRGRIKDGGFIAYEIGYKQGESLREIAKSFSMSAEIIKDLSGNERVAVLRKIK